MAKRVTVLRPESTPAYQSPDLTVTLDAAAIATRVSKAVAQRHREAIRSGDKASGGPQRPLGPKERSRAARGKRDDDRGMGSKGAFPASIRSTKGRGDLKSFTTVAADAFFDEWQGREAARGAEYFDVDGMVEEIVDAELEAELKRQGFQ